MKTILVPTDFSKNANTALRYAAQVFQDFACNIILVHSIENQVSNLTSRIDIGKTEAVVDELYETYEAKMEDLQQQMKLEFKNTNHSYQSIITSLKLSRAILKLVDEKNVEYIVMGGKGRTAATDILLGSNTLKMISRIKNAALLIIPKDYEFKSLSSIGFATGFKRSYTKGELHPLMFLASKNRASIKVLHIHEKEKLNDEQRANFHHLFELLEDNNPECHWLSDDSDNHDAITSYLTKQRIGMLAMIYYKHNAIVQLFREATVKSIAKYTLIPFLVMPTTD